MDYIKIKIETAVKSGDTNMLKSLIERKLLDVQTSMGVNRQTVVHLAAEYGHSECLRYLVAEAGADPNAQTKDGRTAMHFAASNGHLECLKFLLTEAVTDPSKR